MNTTFNIKRLGLLLKGYFIENKQRELTTWGIITIAFIFAHEKTIFYLILFIGGILFATRLFKNLSNTPNAIQYLILPATQTEKLVASILLNTVYYLVMTLAVYIIGNLIGYGIYHLSILPSFINEPYFSNTFNLFSTIKTKSVMINGHFLKETMSYQFSLWILLRKFAFVQSLFMFGALFFKRNSIVKTLLALSAIGFVLLIIELILLKITFGTFHLNSSIIKPETGDFLVDSNYFVRVYGQYLLIPFFWVASYFRLTEKEV